MPKRKKRPTKAEKKANFKSVKAWLKAKKDRRKDEECREEKEKK